MEMKPYIASFVIATPVQGTNRLTVTVPNGFMVAEVIANIPTSATMDILDSGNSIFGSRPLGGGIFATANRKLRLFEPYQCKNTALELICECPEAPTSPITVALIGMWQE
ncbi:hypothetical protein [Desulfurobacterium atlanticum]|uniref:Uncharacterized protein n=1 Tax=Desulfurobacterium atlanticum TaxID=240169 RepID=A0A238ZJF9_9BACT|nr:hypothetical protein [Desulfurobacterium atlanticum]SNR83410.1 hypothetical protein SAMN06265340_10923 [Desulfurobacterium atlanticum]